MNDVRNTGSGLKGSVVSAQSGALSGVRIVDLSRVLGGPFATQMLADHGAEVIKIEPPTGDETRLWGRPVMNGASGYFVNLNRNKRMVALDLRTDDGKSVLMRLLEDADVLVHNFKSGTLERWEIGYDEVLSKHYPGLIYCHITGFGETGPLGGLPGYDGAVQALAGNMSVNGDTSTGPMRVGMPIVDMVAGLNAAFAISMALFERTASGKGQKIDISLYDSAISLQHPHAPNVLLAGETPELTGNAHPNISPYDMYKTGDGDLFLAVGNNGQFAKLCTIIGCPELAQDPRFGTNVSRIANRDALKRHLESALSPFNASDLSQKLLEAGVPAGAVLDVETVLSAPHTQHREMIVTRGNYKATGIPVKFGRTPGSVRTIPAALGAHGREVLEEKGFGREDISRFFANGTLIEDPDTNAG